MQQVVVDEYNQDRVVATTSSREFRMDCDTEYMAEGGLPAGDQATPESLASSKRRVPGRIRSFDFNGILVCG